MRFRPRFAVLLCVMLGCSNSEPAPPTVSEPPETEDVVAIVDTESGDAAVLPPGMEDETTAETVPENPPSNEPSAPAEETDKPTASDKVELPDLSKDENIVPFDLAPYGLFLTIDLPRGATANTVSGVQIDIGEESTIKIYDISRYPDVLEETFKSLRGVKDPQKVITDTPNLVISGLEIPGFENFRMVSKVDIDGQVYVVSNRGGSKANVLKISACAQTLRQTDANRTAAMKNEAARSKLTELGCSFRDYSPGYVGIIGDAITDEDLKLLADLPRLDTVEIFSTGLTAAGLKHLALLPRLANVQYSSKHIDGAWLAPLKKLPALTHLVINDASIAADGWGGLAEVKQLQRLKITVAVSGEFLQAASQLPVLHWLEAEEAGIDDAALAEFKPVSKEKFFLHLDKNPLTDNCLEHLATIKNLKTVRVAKTQITAEGAAKLRTALPDCDVEI